MQARLVSPESAAAALLLTLVAACASQPPPAAPPGGAAGFIGGAFDPAMQALGSALAAREDELAWRMLAALRQRGRRDADLLERLEAYERVLVGRSLAAAVELSLAFEPDPRGGDRLVLLARSSASEALRLDVPPGILERTTVAVSPLGAEARGTRTSSVGALVGLELSPEGERRFDLGSSELETGGALAVRESLRLFVRAGEVELGGRRYPAAHVGEPEAERVRLAPFLPREPLAPEPLIDYARALRISAAAMMERAVRIPPERWEEALDALAPVVESLPVERVAELAPALRWLGRGVDLGADGLAWKRWFASRALAERAPGTDRAGAGTRPPDGGAGGTALELPRPGGA